MPIVHAINFGNCDSIFEYHPKLYDPPPDNNPFIEKITITLANERLTGEDEGETSRP